MPRFDFVLLDADNTLFDFDRAERDALRQAVTDRGHPFTQEIEQAYHAANRALWAAFDRGEAEQSWLVVERFRRLCACLGRDHDPVEFNRDYLTFLGQSSVLFPGVEDLCRTLWEAGCTLAIATNGVARVQHARMDGCPIAPYISHLFISEELGAQKPLTAFFRPALERMGVTDRSRCLMVGDSILSDILGGRNAGLPTAWYNPRGKTNDTDISPTYILSDYEELKELVLT